MYPEEINLQLLQCSGWESWSTIKETPISTSNADLLELHKLVGDMGFEWGIYPGADWTMPSDVQSHLEYLANSSGYPEAPNCTHLECFSMLFDPKFGRNGGQEVSYTLESMGAIAAKLRSRPT